MTRRTSLLVLLSALVVSLFSVVYPFYVIRPFRAQGAQELAVALFIIQYRAAVTLTSGLAALAALFFYWRVQPRRLRRATAAAGAVFTCLLAWLARVNIYELMFHPDAGPSFRAALQVKLANDEKVIAVKIGGAARAYPIRNISYHHVINDVLDKIGIVATY